MRKSLMPGVIAGMALIATAAMATNPPARPGTTAPNEGNLGDRGAQQNRAAAPDAAAPKFSEALVRSSLQAQGYDRIDKVELKGANYEVQARKGTQMFKLEVDATTGQVKSTTPG